MKRQGPRKYAFVFALVIALVFGAIACGSDEYAAGDSPAANYGKNSGARHSIPGNRGTENDYQEGEDYQKWTENKFVEAKKENTSTFSVDVDTASYTIARRDLKNERLPKPMSVRTEEFINFFDYDYREPVQGKPFSINLEAGPSKFGKKKKLLHIGLKGKSLDREQLKPTNLVFLIDVSGSMDSPSKLPLVKRSLRTLLDHLRPSDTVGLVVYAGSEGVVLEPTPVEEKQKIERAISNLESGGSTNAEAGIVSAYRMAERAKIEGGNNRVVLATDGDFNVGKTGQALVELIKEYRKKHISLTAVGYGMGNYQGGQMSTLAQNGNGNYFYVDEKKEAERIFGEDLSSTLQVIASDVKVQVKFDETAVEKYRLVGYETRNLDNEDFANDEKDAAEIGPGHTVTALYEVVPSGKNSEDSDKGRLAKVDLRYKQQYGQKSKLVSRSLKMNQVESSLEQTSKDFRFSAAVTEFAEILRESRYSDDARFDDVISLAKEASDEDNAKRTEFISLVETAKSLW